MFSLFPVKFVIPDLVSHCPFPLRTNRHRVSTTSASKSWLFRGVIGSSFLTSSTARSSPSLIKKLSKFHSLKAGKLTAMCYPTAGAPQLRVCCDFMNYLFHLDNISDEMDSRGTRRTQDIVMDALHHSGKRDSSSGPEVKLGRMTREFFARLSLTASSGARQRFTSTLSLFFDAISRQALDRATGEVPDLESYISLRRDTSGCKPCWALIEYANNLDLPDDVMEHPLVVSLGEAANDLVTWSNDIFSYKVEHSKGDTHNMIAVLMHHHSLSLQSAVDFVGDLCKQSIDRFIEDREALRHCSPAWGKKIDTEVGVYVDGLANWIVGSLHWSFETGRYFGKSGMEIKKTRVVELFPQVAAQQV